MEDRILELVVGKDEVTWQAMLLKLVKQEGMNPWDVNITLLTQKYIEMLKKLKELDFRMSGKMVLAAALLLRLKTSRLIGEDMMELERLMSPEAEQTEEGFYEELEQDQQQTTPGPGEIPQLLPRTPQPRKRKVSIYDLMNALEKALEVRDRRVLRRPILTMKMPEKKVDISKLINGVYERIIAFFGKQETLRYSELIPSPSRDDKIYTFVSLLHLANQDQRKIDLVQKEAFGDIEIILKQQANQSLPTEQPVVSNTPQ